MSTRANNFDALRLIGALLVFYSHQFALAGYREPRLSEAADVSFGALGVFVFFSISGYLVCQSWMRDPNADRFIRRRFLRIWPGMAVTVVITSATLCLFTPVSFWAFLNYLKNLICIGCSSGNAFFPENTHPHLWGSMWTIPLEAQCYGILLAAGMLFGRHFGRFVVGLAVVAMITPLAILVVPTEVLVDFTIGSGWRWPLGIYGALFLAGCLAHVHGTLVQRAWLPIVGGVVLMHEGHFLAGMVFALPLAVIWVGRRSWPGLRQAGRFGDLSYGIYLWAWPVQQVVVMWLGQSWPLWALGAVSLPITLVLAAASWHLVEKQALRLKP